MRSGAGFVPLRPTALYWNVPTLWLKNTECEYILSRVFLKSRVLKDLRGPAELPFFKSPQKRSGFEFKKRFWCWLGFRRYSYFPNRHSGWILRILKNDSGPRLYFDGIQIIRIARLFQSLAMRSWPGLPSRSPSAALL